MGTPWYMYPLDSPGGGYQEMTDPMGNYLKPDTNIGVPGGTPITTFDSGVITSVIDRGRSYAGLSVTEKLDNPPNSQAKYASFNYLGGSNVNVGQRVTQGQKIGTAGSPYGINFALALGVSPTWGVQCPQCASKQPALDPRIILNALRSGKGLPSSTSPTSDSNTSGGGGLSLPGLGTLDVGAITGLFTKLFQEIGVFLIALLLVIIGVMLLMGKQIEGFTKAAIS